MSGSSEDWERWYDGKAGYGERVTRNDPLLAAFSMTKGPVEFTESEPVTGCGCDLERRVKVRMSEAEDAARVARRQIGDPSVDLSLGEIGRLGRLALAHEQLAEALAEVLRGGF